MSIVGPHHQVTTIGDEDKLATMAAFHGRLPEFSGAADEWEVFAEQLEHYFAANGIDDDGKQRAIMLIACGTATYKLLKTLVTPDALTTKTFDELVGLATEHHNPKPSVIMRRFRFNTCVRQQGESITSFVTRLRDLASHCEYGASAKELIRDRLVCGIRDDALQRSLLAVAGLTFEKAFERALLHESAVQNARMLNAPADVHRTPWNRVPRQAKAVNKQCATVAEGVTPPRTAGSVTVCAIIATRRGTSRGSAGAASSRGRSPRPPSARSSSSLRGRAAASNAVAQAGR